MSNGDELRRFVQERLPDYMTPVACTVLEALPLMHSGKIDRQALPSLSPTRSALDRPLNAPRTPVETTLAAIWAEVLRLDRVGIHDQFFELGGHSLLATQVVSRVMQTYQVNLPLRSLLEAPTVADMAMVVTQSLAKQTGQDDVERVLAEMEALTKEQALRLLADEAKRSGASGA
jgi:acyl carrier protein